MSLLLKTIGLVNAVYLLSKHGASQPKCIIGESCSQVLTSIYASIFGVPLAAIGVALFLVLIFIDWTLKTQELSAPLHRKLQLILLTPAAAAGIVLFVVQFIHIQAFCPFCGLNSLLLLVLFILALRPSVAPGPSIPRSSSALNISSGFIVGLVSLALLPIAFSWPSKAANYQLKNESIGVVAGKEIMMSDLKTSKYNARYLDLQRKLYQLKKQYLNHQALTIEAKKSNMSPEAYIAKHAISKIKISDSDIQAFYDERKDSLPDDKTLDDLGPAIKDYLFHEQESIAINALMSKLSKQYNARMTQPQPTPLTVKQNPHDTHAIGKKSAPVHVVEFADLQCGHCKSAFVKFKKIITQFGDNIYFEYRHFPLPNNRFSKQFAKASYCAGDQDHYYEFIELTFANQKKLGKVTPNDLAQKLELDTKAFNTCMLGSSAADKVDADLKEGLRLGIESTPTFIVNGQIMIGVPTADDIASFL